MARITINPNDRLLTKYYATLKELRETKQDLSEGNTRRAFGALLSGLGKRRKLTLIEERQMRSKTTGGSIRTDGSLVDAFERPYAHWEAKDSAVNLDAEIRKKIDVGYPDDNIIFEDTHTAVLYQGGHEARRTLIREKKDFAALLSQYLNYKAEQFENFNQAVQSYGEQIREIATQLKDKIEAAHKDNPAFQRQFDEFIELCRTSLNPNISTEAVDEMLIQHLMTEPIIRRVFNVPHFAQTNVIAAKIEEVIRALTSAFFNRRDFYGGPLETFHKAIEDAAADLDFSDKQTFINSVYEKFFQGYSVDIADTHGIVYTPQEIVDFMCAAVEEVLETEFGKKLGDEGVVIIDPATGTGNFVVNLLSRAHKRNLRNFEEFYRERLFANEVMLMPYYIASLNIEREYYQLTGRAQPFEGLCFVDTLDLARNRQMTFFNEKNSERVERQKNADINVIIGNPPYNVGQVNENDNNKNRKYDVIDKRIRETYVKNSNATLRTQLYDAYVRFFRWAIDRLDGRPGIVCYVSNNSFVDAYAFDGFRKHMMEDFDRVYHLDLGGDLRKKESGDSISNVFDIRVGVGISIAVRSEEFFGHKLLYNRVRESARKEEKLELLRTNTLSSVDWKRLSPNRKYTWLTSGTEAEFEAYLPIGSKESKRARLDQAESIFKTYCSGVKTNRDMHVFDYVLDPLAARMKKFLEDYNGQVDKYRRLNPKPNIDEFVDYELLKWDGTLKNDLRKENYGTFDIAKVGYSFYRPFTKKHLYFDSLIINSVYLHHFFFPATQPKVNNRAICISGAGHDVFRTLVSDRICELKFSNSENGGTQCFPFYTYDQDGSNRTENITDWALDQFRSHYNDTAITKWDIFYYVYGLLHHPGYRERYALDLNATCPESRLRPSFVTTLTPDNNSPTSTSTTKPSTATNSIGTPSANRPASASKRCCPKAKSIPPKATSRSTTR